MPTSASSRAGINKAAPPAPRRALWPIVSIVLLAVATVTVIVLPASLLGRFLPPTIRLDDPSGTVWHGSSGKLTIEGRDAGALEWRLHPASLLRLTLAADLHWVKVGFVADGSIEFDRHTLSARQVAGGGPVEDLQDFGLLPGTRGQLQFNFRELRASLGSEGLLPRSIVGNLSVTDLAVAQLADAANLGGYNLQFADGAITPDSDLTAALNDDGSGPLALQGAIHYVARERTATLSGTLKERATLPENLRQQLASLSQLHTRDAQGRLPVDFEFRL